MAYSRRGRIIFGLDIRRIKYTPKAGEDLRNIKETIKEHFFNEELSIKILSEITKTIRDLAMIDHGLLLFVRPNK